MDADLTPNPPKPRRRKARSRKAPQGARLSEALRWKGATVFLYLDGWADGAAVEGECVDVDVDRTGRLWLRVRAIRGSGYWWHPAEHANVCKEPMKDAEGSNPIELGKWEPREQDSRAAAGGTPEPTQKKVYLPKP